MFSENLRPSTLLKMLVVAEYDVDKAVEVNFYVLILLLLKKKNRTAYNILFF